MNTDRITHYCVNCGAPQVPGGSIVDPERPAWTPADISHLYIYGVQEDREEYKDMAQALARIERQLEQMGAGR